MTPPFKLIHFLLLGFCSLNRKRVNTENELQALKLGSAQQWWEKGLQPDMKKVISAQDLVDSLLNAGHKLVVVDFLSPSCGGYKALHPKICQLGEMNLDVLFLHVNYKEHKSMCYSLNVDVLPFFHREGVRNRSSVSLAGNRAKAIQIETALTHQRT
ncbi:hypothetical protein K2173_014104 [Erythroxylum novogranatense]|uniref:Thioredoxin domain-containing protein n=1 Tax=Erythroxylum novogranatense TaxID=1862640 RepID=A0AAV8SDG7_9ROSI|nr:hypothetical protein K2173_014104 [Erythroxylum novogranatense]